MKSPLQATASRPPRVLITGGAGFIGANLTRILLREHFQVRIVDNFSQGTEPYLRGLPVEIIQGDIQETAQLPVWLRDCGAVVHLAGQTGVPKSLQDPVRDCELNVLGTLRLLEACRSLWPRGAGRFIYASSNAPLGRQPPPAREDLAPLPISPYGASKQAGEAYCLAYHGAWGLPAVALRFANVYGPFSAHKNSVVAHFMKQILAQSPLNLDGGGLQTRDFIYVEDLCAAILAALRCPAEGEIIQIATGVETSIQDLAARIIKLAGNSVVCEKAPVRAGDMQRNFSEISKAARLLGWRPGTSLDTGLASTWHWFQQWP